MPVDGSTVSSPLAAQHLDRRHLAAQIITDLAVVACGRWRSSLDLLQAASKRLPPDGATVSPGVGAFLQRCLALALLGGSGNDDDAMAAAAAGDVASVNAALLTCTQPLAAARLQGYAAALARIKGAWREGGKAVGTAGRPRGVSLLLEDMVPTDTVNAVVTRLVGTCQTHLPPGGLTAFLVQ